MINRDHASVSMFHAATVTPDALERPPAGARGGARQPVVALLPRGDRFEDFHDRIGVTPEEFCERVTGTWLFNYVEAFQAAGVRCVLYFVSARVPGIVRFTHRPTGSQIRFLPAPLVHRKLQGARDRFRVGSPLFSSVLSYGATPWRALTRELRRDGCEAILCQEYEYPRFDEAVVLGRILRMPVFATYQGGNAPGSALERPLRRAAIARAAGLVIGARSEIQRVRATYGIAKERTALIPNGLDVTAWRPADRQASRTALGIAPDLRVVVWHGRVEVDKKGLDVLLDAWEQLHARRRGEPLLLLLVGSGQDREVLRRRLVSLPPGSVRWDEGWVRDRAVLVRYLSAADVATLSSRREGFSVAVLEAMACGLPVVATDVSGVTDAFGDEPAGVIVRPEDPAALAGALGRLLDDEPLRRDLGARARRRAEREFSLETVGRRLRAFMEERGAFSAAQQHPAELPRSVMESLIRTPAPEPLIRQPLRIAHVIDAPFGVESANGVQQVVSCLAGAQAEAGQFVTVFSSLDGVHVIGDVSEPATPASGATPVRHGHSLRHRLVARSLKPGITESLLAWRPDVVHFHSIHVPQNIALADDLSGAGIPYCVTVHGGLFPAALRRGRLKKAAFNLLFERHYLNDASFVHALSPHEVDAIRRYGVTCPIVLAPNGLAAADVRPTQPDARWAAHPALRNRRVFMFVGRLDRWHKGLDLLVEAFARAALRGAAVVLVGPDARGSRRMLKERARQLGISSDVVFTGPAFGQDRINLFAAADVFVHPSRWEGLSLSVLTAAAAGKPCLITRAADPLGELERAGAALIVEPTVSSLAEGLKRMASLAEGELQAMGARAREVAEKQPTWPAIADRLVAAYRRALGVRETTGRRR